MIDYALSTVAYDQSKKEDITAFCEKCKTYNYKNNDSIDSMRLDWCINQGGQFFLTYLDTQLISVSGCHPLPEAGTNVFRVLFRGVVLKEYQNLFGIVSKTHMTSIPFFYHLPHQVTWARSKGYEKFCITTNWNNPDGITSMGHSHKVMQLLEKQGLVRCLIDKLHLYHTDQTVWEVNIAKYTEIRNQFRDRHGLSE